MKNAVNFESKKEHGRRIHEANSTHNDRKNKKGLRIPKNKPYNRAKACLFDDSDEWDGKYAEYYYMVK